MKLRLLVFLVIIMALAAPALAQNDLPGTAVDAVGLIEAGLVALSGLLAWAVTDAIRKWAWLPEQDRSKIGGAAANLVAAVVAVASGFIVGWLGHWAGILDASGTWAVLVFAWPAAKGWFELTGWRKAVEEWLARRGLVQGELLEMVSDPGRD